MTVVDKAAWPRDLLTLSDWDDLDPDEGHHIECVEGALVLAPTPRPLHRTAMATLTSILKEQLRPAGLAAAPDTDVVLNTSPLTVRAPDVVVVQRDRLRANPVHFDGRDVVLAVEIVSEGSRRMGRVMKANEYAEAGIPDYWILEGDPFVLSAYHLESGVYRLVSEYVESADLTVAGAPVHVDLAALLDV